MLITYLFSKYLQKKDDYSFETFWETKFIPKTRYYFIGATLYFIVVDGLIIELLLWGNESVFFGIIVFFLFTMFFGVYYLRAIFKFFGRQNRRYLQIKSGMTQDEFDKSNVIN